LNIKTRIQQALNIRTDEWGLLLVLIALIALNTMALESADVVATSSYLAQLGMSALPLLWLADMAVIGLSSALYTLIADRFPRRTLLQGLMLGFGGTLLVIRGLIAYSSPGISYTLLYILVDQQLILFPLSFWALANDHYNVAASKRLFPIIAAGGLIGNVLGNGLAGQSALLLRRWGCSGDDLLFVCSALFFLTWSLVTLALPKRQPAPPPAAISANVLRETWEVGRDFVKNIPLFRYLFLALFLSEIALTIIEYHFLAQATGRFADLLQFQTFYGIYKAALTVLPLLLQLFVTGRLMEKLGLKNVFFIYPAVLFLGSATAMTFLNFAAAVGANLSARIVLNAVESPARKSVQGLIPDAKRGRVGAFLDSYVYAVGTMAGCLILEGWILLGENAILSPQTVIIGYNMLSAVAATATLFLVFRLHKTYDESLWHPWLARRKRHSMTSSLLEKL